LFFFCFVAFAHHGASEWDMQHSISVKGTVTDFDWSNPHAMIFFDAKNGSDRVQKWSVEIRGGPNVLARAGWKKDTLKPGDQLTFIGHPAKDRTNRMRLEKILLPNGQELSPDPPRSSWWPF
jgi:hypothetical protein